MKKRKKAKIIDFHLKKTKIQIEKQIVRTVQMTYDWNLLNLLLFFPAIFAQV